MHIFFEGWPALGRVMVITPLAYLGLIALLRLSGKRTLTKLNAFDLVITVSLGSTLASTILSKSTTLLEGLLAFSSLIGLQFVVTWSSVRWPFMERLVKAEPTLLVRRGQILERAMRDQRVTREELFEVLRASGHSQPGEVGAVVLETDGTFSVLADVQDWGEGALNDLPRVTAKS